MAIASHKLTLFLFVFYFIHVFKPTNSEESLQKFNGHEIKLLAYHFSPLFSYNKQRSGNYSFEGLFYEYMQDAQNYFGFKYKYLIVDEVEVKKYGLNGALLNYLDRKEVDIIPYVFYQELSNLKHMELTATVWIDPEAIMQPWPDEENRLHVAIKPFQLMLWITFISCTAIFILTTTAFVKIQEKFDPIDDHPHKSIGETVYHQFEFVIRIITAQEGYLVRYQSRRSFKLLIGFWLISMVALINAYTSVMTALLTVPKLEPIANTLEEAVIQNRLVTIEINTPMSRIMLEATKGYEKQIADQFQQDATLWTTDPLVATYYVLHRKCVHPTAMSLINYIIYQDTKSNGHCRMTFSTELKAYNHLLFQMGFPIKSPIASSFNGFFLRMNAAGIIDEYKKRFFSSSKQCRTDIPFKKTTRSLTLFDLTAPFLIIGAGLSFSILAFVIEIVVNFIIDRLDY